MSLSVRELKALLDTPGLSRLSRDARLLYVGLHAVVDAHGLFKMDSALIRELLFETDPSATRKNIVSWLSELTNAGLVAPYWQYQVGRTKSPERATYCAYLVGAETLRTQAPAATRPLPPPPIGQRLTAAAYVRRARGVCALCNSQTSLLAPTLDGNGWPLERPANSGYQDGHSGQWLLLATGDMYPEEVTLVHALCFESIPDEARSAENLPKFTASSLNGHELGSMTTHSTLTESAVSVLGEGSLAAIVPLTWDDATKAVYFGTQSSAFTASSLSTHDFRVTVQSKFLQEGKGREGEKEEEGSERSSLDARAWARADTHSLIACGAQPLLSPASDPKSADSEQQEKTGKDDGGSGTPNKQAALFAVPDHEPKIDEQVRTRRKPRYYTPELEALAREIIDEWWATLPNGKWIQGWHPVYTTVMSVLHNQMSAEDVRIALRIVAAQGRPVSGGSLMMALTKKEKTKEADRYLEINAAARVSDGYEDESGW